MLEPLHFPHRWSSMCCAIWLLCGSSDDGESMTPASRLLLQRTRAQTPSQGFQNRKPVYIHANMHHGLPPTVSVKESNCAVVDFVVGGMAEGCSC